MKKLLSLFLLVTLIALPACGTGNVNPVDKYHALVAKGDFEEARSLREELSEEDVAVIEAKLDELFEAQELVVTSTGHTMYVDDITGRPLGTYDAKISVSNKSNRIITSYVIAYRFHQGFGNLPLSDFLEASNEYANFMPLSDYTITTKRYTRCSSDSVRVRAVVKRVTFTDGSTWENPFYPYWRAA